MLMSRSSNISAMVSANLSLMVMPRRRIIISSCHSSHKGALRERVGQGERRNGTIVGSKANERANREGKTTISQWHRHHPRRSNTLKTHPLPAKPATVDGQLNFKVFGLTKDFAEVVFEHTLNNLQMTMWCGEVKLRRK
jgi:hypothetical protein